jgi:ketosteroid isomerase-like protein
MDVRSVQQALQRLVAAAAVGDVDAYVAEWADDGTVIRSGQPTISGWKAIRAWAASTFERCTLHLELTAHDWQTGGEWVIDRHRYAVTVTPKSGGAPVVDRGTAVAIWKRMPDGTWKTLIECWNSDAVQSTEKSGEHSETAYKEVCQNHRAVTDFRGKLLTVLPLASGAGIYVLLPKGSDPSTVDPVYLLAIGVFGVLVTLGLFLHELRGIEQCGALIDVGRALEEAMGMRRGQFSRDFEYYHPGPRLQRFINQVKGPVGAAFIIYPSVAVAWLFVAALGLRRMF